MLAISYTVKADDTVAWQARGLKGGYSGQTQPKPNDRDHSACTPLLPTRKCSQPTSRAMWEWQDATWHRVNSKDAQVLEAAYSQDAMGLHYLAMGPHKRLYQIDFSVMKQWNQVSGSMRYLRRKARAVQENVLESESEKELNQLEEAFLKAELLVAEAADCRNIIEVPEIAPCIEAELGGQNAGAEKEDILQTHRANGLLALQPGVLKASEKEAEDFARLPMLQRSVERGHIGLLRASWLRGLLAEPSQPLPQRQALPPEAFWNDFSSLTGNVSSRLLVVSHFWQEEQPESDCQMLELLAKMVEKHSQRLSLEEHGTEFAIFLDWCSLYQQPRSEDEEATYQRSLQDMSAWYASPCTTKWFMPSSDSIHIWPCLQRMLANLSSESLVVEASEAVAQSSCPLSPSRPTLLQASGASGSPPTTPSAFNLMIQSQGFDEHVVSLAQSLYHKAFTAVLGAQEWMDFSSRGWDDFHALRLAEVLVHSQHLVKLVLSENSISDVGMEAIAACLPGTLQILDISHNIISDVGAGCLAGALAKLPELRQLYISANSFGENGFAALASKLPLCQKLSTLRAAKLGLGDALQALALVLPQCPNLQSLCLNENQMGSASASLLASTLTSFIEELQLDDNAIGDVGIRALAGRFKDSSHLRLLSLNENCFGDSGAAALARALPSCPALRTLRVSCNHISPQALNRLRLAVPGLNLFAFGQTARARWIGEILPASSLGIHVWLRSCIMWKAGATEPVRFFMFDFDQTLTVFHVFKSLSGWKQEGVCASIPKPHAMSELGQVARIDELSSGEFATQGGFPCAAFGGSSRVEEVRRMLQSLQKEDAEMVICTKGFVGPVQLCLHALGLRSYFTQVYGHIGVTYGTSPFDKQAALQLSTPALKHADADYWLLTVTDSPAYRCRLLALSVSLSLSLSLALSLSLSLSLLNNIV
ncbi:Nlrc5 [Symbiodinium microadriaticum]|nr:Nlrc5 [Symbiodinium microadriaticum]